MAILRDVLASFTVFVDDKPLSKLDKKINILKDKIASFAQAGAVAFTAAGYGAYRLVDAASDAAESLNVLRQTFKENSDAVVAWSQTVGKELGRSEFSLQDSVGRFGSFLRPMLQGTNADIMTMSQNLSRLAVDLASFYNTSDEEAAMRLFSGISGETEAVRRLGVDISDAGLAAFHRERGGKTKYNLLSTQEKTQLRYLKILRDTTDAQGDAQRTAGDWANSVRRVSDQIKDLAVRVGRRLLPVALKLLKWGEKFVDVLETVFVKSAAVEGALVTAAAAGTYMLFSWYQKNKMYLEVILLAVQHTKALQLQILAAGKAVALLSVKLAVLTAAFLLIEDFIGFLQGKKSVIGEFLKQMTGLEKPLDIFKQMSKDIAYYWDSLSRNIGEAVKVLLKLRGQDVGPINWSNFGLQPRQSPEQEGKARHLKAQEAARKGDHVAFREAYEGMGLGNSQIVDKYKQYRQAMLRIDPSVVSTEEDYRYGLSSPERYAADKVKREAQAKLQAEQASKAQAARAARDAAARAQKATTPAPYVSKNAVPLPPTAPGLDVNVNVELSGEKPTATVEVKDASTGKVLRQAAAALGRGK